MTHAPLLRSRLQALVAFLLLATAASLPSHAQGFDASRYYQQCLRFEAGGDFETARQSCLNALQVNPDLHEARLALGRIELALDDLAAAEGRLIEVRDRVASAEPLVLLAEIALRTDRNAEAEAYLQSARARLERQYNSDLASRAAFLGGGLEERQGRLDEAIARYREAVEADPLNSRYRNALARLLFEMGDTGAARRELTSYLAVSGDGSDPELRALLGRVLWAEGELDGAARELETALTLRSGRDTDAQARDLRTLALIYYGAGNTRAGGLALRDAMRRGNLLSTFFSDSLLWLLLLLVVLTIHLLGESRIAPTTTMEVIEGPEPWRVGDVYRILLGSLLVGLAAALAYGVAMYDNLLAFLTPVQSNETRAVFLLATTLVAVALAYRQTRRKGWNPTERLLGRSDSLGDGLILGLVLLAATIAYLALLPETGWRGDFYLDLARITPLVAATMVLIPLGEVFFRAFAFRALELRYDRDLAVLLSAGLSALVYATPVLLLVAIGLALAETFKRQRNGVDILLASLVLHVGLLLGVAFVPWVRGLFV